MGELTPMDLRTLASHQHYDAPLRQALQWAADRIDYLEGFIESYERAKADPRHAAIDEMAAESQRLGLYDEDRCSQCGKRYPSATCPACQEQNIRDLNDLRDLNKD